VLQIKISATTAVICWLSPPVRLAVHASFIGSDRESATTELYTSLETLLSQVGLAYGTARALPPIY